MSENKDIINMEKVVKVINHMEQPPERDQSPSTEKQKQHKLFLCLQVQDLIINYYTMKILLKCLTFLISRAYFKLNF